MKILSHVRLNALRVVAAFALLITAISILFATNSSSAAPGQTGNALALRAFSHARMGKSIFDNGIPTRPAQGREPIDLAALRALVTRRVEKSHGAHADAVMSAPIVINDPGVQTFDVFAPPGNNFAPADGALTATNLTPVWSADRSYIVFASNMAGDGHTHLFAISEGGDLTGQTSSLRQITTGSGDEMFPALNAGNSAIAFTSTAGNGTPNLYVMPFNASAFSGTANAVNVATLTSLTIRADLVTGFGAVARPTWAPDGNRIAFSAVDANASPNPLSHIWFLYTATDGYQPATTQAPGPTASNPPAELTSGTANDTDPAWSPDGDYIAFASTATSITTNPSGSNVGPGTAPTVTSGNQAVRNLFLISGGTTASGSLFGTVPTGSAPASTTFDGHVTNSNTVDDFGPAWSTNTENDYLNPNADANGGFEYLAWGSGTGIAGAHNIEYLRLTQLSGARSLISAVGKLTAGGSTNAPITLNTDKAAGESNTSGFTPSDIYPTWAPFVSANGQTSSLDLSTPTIAYASDRSVTYNDPTTGAPRELALSLMPGTDSVGAGYTGILESEILNLDPPLLLPFGNGDVVRVSNPNGVTTRDIQPGQVATFTVRLSSREAGTDPNNVYVQIKDPESKFENSEGLEHKVFTRDFQAFEQNPVPDTSGSELDLFNGDLGNGYNVLSVGGTSQNVSQRGATGGVDGSDTISIGTYLPSTFALSLSNNNNPVTKALEVDDKLFTPWGQEYECQVVNPMVANPDTAVGDFSRPFYLAGVDDALPLSGVFQAPRPNTQWIKLTPAVPLDANSNLVPDADGGVLFTGTYTTPSSFGSDFYVDTIAYDNATFPALPPDTSNFVGFSKNWRIYDNVGGFTTAPFDGSTNILVVSDNALGQKFAGSFSDLNLPPIFYGAESYYTGIDTALLPNCVYFNSEPTAPTAPPVPAASNGTVPTRLSATPGNSQVTLEWSGVATPPTNGYNIYRSSSMAGIVAHGGNTASDFLRNVPGTMTSFVDTTAGNGTVNYYEVTAVNGAVESAPSNEPLAAVPFAPNTPVAQVQELDPSVGPVENGLGFGSYDNTQAQTYSIWRILSRGPVPATVLQAYAPTTVTQPAVNDAVNGKTAVAADGTAAPRVTVATRCVIWASPFTGDLLVGAGSILDSSTQALLSAFVLGGTVNGITFPSGGRLFVSGQDVGSAITHDGAANNSLANGDFLPTVLNATLSTANGGNQILTAAAAAGNRISYDAFFNASPGANIVQNFLELQPNLIPNYFAPGQSPVFELGNDFLEPPQGSAQLMSRTDGSLDQIGGAPHVFVIGTDVVQGQIDTIVAQNGAHTDINFNNGTGPGLIYGENSALGSRTVYASFGLEALGIEYYKIMDTGNPSLPHYSPRNLRPDVLHNIVDYLRTGTYSGKITESGQGGAGVPGATVYLMANQGATIPGSPANRQLFSAITDSSGNYVINGVEPGGYVVIAYKTGFNRATSADDLVASAVNGDGSEVVNLNLNPLPPGTITGQVLAGTSPVPNATVTFVASDGQATVTATTGSNGDYTINSVPAGTYSGMATAPGYGPPAAGVTPGATVTATVTSGDTTANVNFGLVVVPGTIGGQVTDDFTNLPISGVTVTATNTTTGVATTFTTTTPTTPAAGATGDGSAINYTGTLTQGTYTVVITPPANYSNPQPATATVTVTSGAFSRQDFTLTSTTGQIGGLVVDETNTPLSGATVTVTNSAGGVVGSAFTTTAADPNTPPAPLGDGQPANYFGSIPEGGPYTVTISAPNRVTQTITNVTIVTHQFTRENTQMGGLVSTLGQLGGLVTDSFTNAPIAGATVVIVGPGGTAITGSPFTTVATPTASPAGGTATINFGPTTLTQGVYTLTVSAPNHTTQTVTVNVVHDQFNPANVALVSTQGTIGGFVTLASSGSRLDGASVTITDPTSTVVYQTTTSGQVTSPAAPTGDGGVVNYSATLTAGVLYTVTVSDLGGGTATQPDYSTQTFTVTPVVNTFTRKDVALKSAYGSLAGLITDSFTKQPIAGAAITVTNAAGSVVATVTSLTAVDAQSQNYSVSQLYQGTYTVSAAATNHTTQSASVTIVGGAATAQNFALVSTIGTVGGLVEDSFTGAPISGVTVTLANATTGVTVATFTTSATLTAAPDGGQLNYTGSVAQGTYTVTITRRGYGAAAAKTITITPNAFTRADFTGTSGLPPGHIFNGTGQYLFFSVPYDYASSGVGFDQLFGVLNTGTFSPLVLNPPNANRSHVYVWDPTALDYATEPTPPADGLHLGQGYWVYLVKPTEANVAGTAATGTVSVPLKTGWNMIGVPSLSAISLSNVTFNNPSTNATVTFAQAISTYKLISSPLYGYTTGGGYYQVAAGASLQPWQAYWIYAFSPTTIEMPTGQ